MNTRIEQSHNIQDWKFRHTEDKHRERPYHIALRQFVTIHKHVVYTSLCELTEKKEWVTRASELWLAAVTVLSRLKGFQGSSGSPLLWFPIDHDWKGSKQNILAQHTLWFK